MHYEIENNTFWECLLGWWFVCDNEDNQGWVPATYLESVGTTVEGDTDEWVSMDDSDSHGMTAFVLKFLLENSDGLRT